MAIDVCVGSKGAQQKTKHLNGRQQRKGVQVKSPFRQVGNWKSVFRMNLVTDYILKNKALPPGLQ